MTDLKSPLRITFQKIKKKFFSPKLISRAESEVRDNEEASLQDSSYTFDSDNTGNEDIHDTMDFSGYEEQPGQQT